jgi:predicted enzyme related to lactoylglutathione lyase
MSPSAQANIRIEVGIDSVDPESLAPFWVEALGYALGKPDPEGTYLELVPPPGSPPVYLQRVPEPKSTKNRLHLDLFTTEPDALVTRLTGIGATKVGEAFTNTSGSWWQVMADPEGNEFCVCREET